MTACPDCKGPVKPLFTGMYCVNACDKPKPRRVYKIEPSTYSHTGSDVTPPLRTFDLRVANILFNFPATSVICQQARSAYVGWKNQIGTSLEWLTWAKPRFNSQFVLLVDDVLAVDINRVHRANSPTSLDFVTHESAADFLFG